MFRVAIFFLLLCTAYGGPVHRLSPLGESWKEHAKERYSEIFQEETIIALLCAPSSVWEIEYAAAGGFNIRYLIYITQEHEKNFIHLRDIYKDAERTFTCEISQRDLNVIREFFSEALTDLELFNWDGLDGTPHIIRVKGAVNEFAYTWSPKRYTYASDISNVMRMLRDDCIRSLGGNFFLSPHTEDFMEIVRLTPASMRENFIKKHKALPLRGAGRGTVDPFNTLDEKEHEDQKDEMVKASYRSNQLRLLFEYKRKLMLSSARGVSK